jgi:hypothetical protein
MIRRCVGTLWHVHVCRRLSSRARRRQAQAAFLFGFVAKINYKNYWRRPQHIHDTATRARATPHGERAPHTRVLIFVIFVFAPAIRHTAYGHLC